MTQNPCHASIGSRCFISLVLMMSCLISACQGPEETGRKNVYEATDGEEYELDVFMVAEWAGHIIPQKEKLRLNLSFNSDDPEHPTITDVSTNADLTPLFAFEENAGGRILYFHPYGTDASASSPPLSDIAYECMHLGTSDNLDGEYICDTYRSGAHEIKALWDYIKTSGKSEPNTPDLIIGSGDNFGVSQVISKTYGDYPTIQMLNALGMDADTFGNHAFDITLQELQALINVAKFPFIISNFSNLPNNLEKTAPYHVFQIPSQNKSDKKLNVAVVAAFESEGMSIISRGHFGTIDIANYCPVIQALEETYNKNARAFIVLSHVFTDQDSILKFFNGIFSLDEAFYNHLQSSSSSLSDDYPCRSHLIITDDMLTDDDKVSKADQAAALRLKIHQEIYDNLLMVYGEATYTPFMLGMIPGLSETPTCSESNKIDPDLQDASFYAYQPDGCIHTPNDNSDTYSIFTNHSRFPTNNPHIPSVEPAFEKALTSLNFPSFEFDENSLEANADKHPIWFMDLHRRNYSATRAKFKIIRDSSNPNPSYHNIPGTAAAYKSQMVNFKLMPVFGEPFIKSAYTPEVCERLFTEDYKSSVPESCREYYKQYDAYTSQTESQAEAPSYTACALDMISADGTLRSFQEIWTCLYNKTSNQVCTFAPYSIGSEHKDKEIRKYSTFITNFVTDTLLRHFKNNNAKVDAIYIGAGTTRETLDFSEIDNEFFNASLPFSNKVTSIPFSMQDLVHDLEIGFNNTISGGFPAIAGLKVSYAVESKDGEPYNAIQEIWLNDLETNTHTLLYLGKNVQENACILGAQYKDTTGATQCIFGHYQSIKHNSDGNAILAIVQVEENHFYEDGFIKNADTQEFNLDMNRTVYVAITNYMITGGDNFPNKLGILGSNEISDNLNNSFKEALSEGKCTIQANSYSLNTEDILKHNLVKRIYYIPSADDTEGVGEPGYAHDYPDNICIATQDILATALMADNVLEEDSCRYHEKASE